MLFNVIYLNIAGRLSMENIYNLDKRRSRILVIGITHYPMVLLVVVNGD